MATGLDEDFKRPKNVTDQIVRLLDDESVTLTDRIRLVLQYILYRDGIFSGDAQKLLAHAQLPQHEAELAQNMDLLGARTVRQPKEATPGPQPVFVRRQAPPTNGEELSLTRFEPNLKLLLEELAKGALDPLLFPYTKPQTDSNDNMIAQVGHAQASLRSTKPTWARTRPSTQEPRQRVIVFMAGGATYSESRACYETSRQFNKDVYMATSHMLTPSLYLRQLTDLSVDRRRLDLPADQPPREAPPHVFEKDAPPPPPPPQKNFQPQPPVTGMANMRVGQKQAPDANGSSHLSEGQQTTQATHHQQRMPSPSRQHQGTRPPPPHTHEPPASDRHKGKEAKEKKHHKFFKF